MNETEHDYCARAAIAGGVGTAISTHFGESWASCTERSTYTGTVAINPDLQDAIAKLERHGFEELQIVRLRIFLVTVHPSERREATDNLVALFMDAKECIEWNGIEGMVEIAAEMAGYYLTPVAKRLSEAV